MIRVAYGIIIIDKNIHFEFKIRFVAKAHWLFSKAERGQQHQGVIVQA